MSLEMARGTEAGSAEAVPRFPAFPAAQPVPAEARARLLMAPAIDVTESAIRSRVPRGLLVLPHPSGAVLLPAFQLTGGNESRRIVLDINELLCADVDPWGVADWWLGLNARLGMAPADLLGHDGRDRAGDVRLRTVAQALLEVE